MHPDDVDTGAVILTGEALRRENAQGDRRRAGRGGRRVRLRGRRPSHGVDARGLRLGRGEGLARSRGGDSQHRHRRRHDEARARRERARSCTRRRFISAVDSRSSTPTAGSSASIRRAGSWPRSPGCDWHLGDRVTEADVRRVAEWMADALVAALTQDPAPPEVADLWLTEPLGIIGGIAGAMFSGGVGEYVYGREDRDFGDLGRLLRARDPRTPRRATSAASPLAGRRVHPRHCAGRLGIQRAAVGQHRLRLEPA